MSLAELSPHLPAHPEQQNATGEEQTYQLQQLHGHHSQAQAQDHGGNQAVEDGPASLFRRQTRGSEADSDSVVPSQGQVDHDDLGQGDQGLGGGKGNVQQGSF
jgi:CRISPR/Cas system CSM-associated protein Csm4 (group 5 of RAMP superfamily)